MRSLRSRLYWLARLLGDLNALIQGPLPFIRRLLRKAYLRWVGKTGDRI